MLCSPLCSGVVRADAASDQQIIDLLQDIYNHQSTEFTSKQIENALDGSSGVKQLLNAAYGRLNSIDDVLNEIHRDIPDYSTQLSTISSTLSTVNSSIKSGNTANHNDLNALKNALQNVYARQLAAMNMNSNMLERLAGKSGGGDVLAGNPWWATNSAFTFTDAAYSRAYPSESPDHALTYSFPQFASKFAGFLTMPDDTESTTYSRRKMESGAWVPLFGFRRKTSFNARTPYTWFDWMADAMRSNWVLQASLAGTTDAPNEVDTEARSAVDDGSTSGTNGVPAMVVEQMDVTGVEAGLELVDADAVGNMFPGSFTGADPEFVVFSGGRYGAVTVPEVRGSLRIPDNVARYLRGVATWLWRVALFVGCFVILRQEVAFWSTLGGSTSDA